MQNDVLLSLHEVSFSQLDFEEQLALEAVGDDSMNPEVLLEQFQERAAREELLDILEQKPGLSRLIALEHSRGKRNLLRLIK